MATAFQTEFVIRTDCELSGRTPSDQFDAWSQLPLAGLIQELTCAETEVNAIADAKKHTARPFPVIGHIGVRMVTTSLKFLPFTLERLGRRC